MTYVHGVATGRDLAGVTLSQSPVDGVGKSVLAEVGDELLVDLKGGEVGYETVRLLLHHGTKWSGGIREERMASSENASTTVGSYAVALRNLL